MDDLIPELHESYNGLLGIVEANRALRTIGGEETVGKILSVIADAGLEDVVGIRLLHRHNNISGDEMMFESDVIDPEGFALITSAVRTSQIEESSSNSWQFTASGYLPTEFSDPNLLADPDFSVKDHQRTFNYLSEALCDYRAETVLGPCVNYSEFVTSFSPGANSAFLEKTDSDHRLNVVRYISITDSAFINSAKTKWLAKRIIDDQGIRKWTTACSCYCAVFPAGGHQGTKYHQLKE
jgi:hypothetical protein